MAMRNRDCRLYCAVDTADLTVATTLARCLAGSVDGLKLGLEFYLANGPAGTRQIAEAGRPIFLDLKLHDIPNTVAGAVRAVTSLGSAILTLHAGGGPRMMRRAVEEARAEAEKTGRTRPRLVGVTILTSLDRSDLDAIGFDREPVDQVRRLADLAIESGLDGVVCSPREIAALRRQLGDEALLVVPGIRPAGSSADDQKRVMTPSEARDAGADILVVGRPITGSADPVAAADAIMRDIADGA